MGCLAPGGVGARNLIRCDREAGEPLGGGGVRP
jgi:hypothetical protein